eukprot:scaffold51_cov401-Prasinococcus_capsulatus_cf.AAC.25
MATSSLRRYLFNLFVAAPVAITVNDLLFTVHRVPDTAMQPTLNPQLDTSSELQRGQQSGGLRMALGDRYNDWVLVDKYSARHQMISPGDVVVYR